MSQIQIQSVDELLFHLENLSLRTPEPGTVGAHKPYLINRDTPCHDGAHALISAWFDTAPVSAIDLALSKDEYRRVSDALFENLITRFHAAGEHKMLVASKRQLVLSLREAGADSTAFFKAETQVNAEILEKVKQKHPGLYAQGIDGLWNRYVAWTHSEFPRSSDDTDKATG